MIMNYIVYHSNIYKDIHIRALPQSITTNITSVTSVVCTKLTIYIYYMTQFPLSLTVLA